MKENFFQEFRTKALKLSFSEDKIKCPKCPREFSKTKYRNPHLKKCGITNHVAKSSRKIYFAKTFEMASQRSKPTIRNMW